MPKSNLIQVGEREVTFKSGPLTQLPLPASYDRAKAHREILRAGSTKGEFNPYKVKPRPGYVWGKIIDVWKDQDPTSTLVRPGNAKATVRHWLTTLEGRRLIFEYAAGTLFRVHDEEWLMVREKQILAEFIVRQDDDEILLFNNSVLLKMDPLPDHTQGGLYAPEMRQVQAETATVMADSSFLNLDGGTAVAIIATAGSYCLIKGEEYRIVHQDQIMGVLGDF